MLLKFRERRFAKQAVRQLLQSLSAVRTASPDLSGRALYREVLLHTRLVDPSHVDRILQQAEDSIDEWTTPESTGLGFREVAHFFVMSRYLDAGHSGTVVSFRDVVHALVPANL